MTMPPGMLGALLGGVDLSSLMPDLPCALCLLAQVDEPAQGVTLAGGSLVCAEHVRAALGVVEHVDPLDVAGTVTALALSTAAATNPATAAVLRDAARELDEAGA